MTTTSKTLKINNAAYETIASLANITLTQDKTYSCQIQGTAFIKIADAEFVLTNEKFYFTQGGDNVYIKNNASVPAVLTILETA